MRFSTALAGSLPSLRVRLAPTICRKSMTQEATKRLLSRSPIKKWENAFRKPLRRFLLHGI
jgi:hypothetical protein